jgi:hypothetical protein
MIATMDQQSIHHQPDTGADAKAIFGQHWGLHEKPLSSHDDAVIICSEYSLRNLFL